MPGSDPPPLPPAPEVVGYKIPPAVLKMRSSSPSKYFPPQTARAIDSGPIPTGLYFFYGSLQDPILLVDILKLGSPPILRSAHIDGFKCQLWGHYPALLNGSRDDTVTGTVYEVHNVDDAKLLADYEGPSYQLVKAYVFLFVGNLHNLSEGSFDLEKWLEMRALVKKAPQK
ncbi:unnamed protein product [Penicillium bialowiezense]